jgi:hypothetical protein
MLVSSLDIMLRRSIRRLQPLVKCSPDSLKPQSIEQASSILDQYGIVVLSKQLLAYTFPINWEALELEINDINKTLCADISEIRKVLLSDSVFGILDPRQASNSAKNGQTLIHERGAYFYNSHTHKWTDIDNGIIDIFNISSWLVKYSDFNRTYNWIKSICISVINKTGSYAIDDEKTYTNAYIYKGVASPRCLHVDTHSTQFKIFFPTCDIHSIASGPISYVPKSHCGINKKRAQMSSLLNKLLGSDIGAYRNDATLFGNQESLPIFTSLGDVVIGNQTCVHGDLPYLGETSLIHPYQKIVIVSNLF